MRLIRHLPSSRGDTIVEVLICVSIVSLVLVSAFVVAQKSNAGVRTSQESSEAQQLLNSQVESLRQMAQSQETSVGGVFATNPRYFCIDNSTPTQPRRHDFPSGFNLPELNGDEFQYPAVCKSSLYNYAIWYDGGSFHAVVRWDRLTGGKSEQHIVYRVYSGAPVSMVASPTN